MDACSYAELTDYGSGITDAGLVCGGKSLLLSWVEAFAVLANCGDIRRHKETSHLQCMVLTTFPLCIAVSNLHTLQPHNNSKSDSKK